MFGVWGLGIPVFFLEGELWRIVWYVDCGMIVWVWMDDGMLLGVRGKWRTRDVNDVCNT
jgi:hypothetical protein